ncbi:hypothetical protein GCM10027408_12210 [Microbacterium tumbae]
MPCGVLMLRRYARHPTRTVGPASDTRRGPGVRPGRSGADTPDAGPMDPKHPASGVSAPGGAGDPGTDACGERALPEAAVGRRIMPAGRHGTDSAQVARVKSVQ